jgi:hypothetical protein
MLACWLTTLVRLVAHFTVRPRRITASLGGPNPKSTDVATVPPVTSNGAGGIQATVALALAMFGLAAA